MAEEPGPPPDKRTVTVRMSKRRYLPLVLSIVALAMVCGSLLGPWYTYNLRDGPDYAGVVRYSYSNLDIFGSHGYAAEYDRETSTSWDDADDDDNVARLFLHLRALVIIGTVLGVATFGGCLLALRRGKRGGAVALATLLAAWCLFTPVFFMVSYGPAVSADSHSGTDIPAFWRESDNWDYEVGAPGNIHHRISTWSPGIGWYFSILAGVFGALAALALAISEPRPRLAGLRRPLAAALAAALLLVGSAMALYPAPIEREWGDGGVRCRVEALAGGDWIIYITGNSARISGLVIQVVNSSTGSKLIEEPVSFGTPDNPDFSWNDTNRNLRLDYGDTIILKGTVNGQPNPNIQAGFRVQFLRNNNVIGTIKELPAH